jgi:hypothetical protein
VTDQSAEDLTKSAGDGGTGAQPDPPAANQGKDEPIASTPDESGQGSSGGTGEGSSGETEHAAGRGDMPAATTGGVPTPGDSKGVSVPAVQAAAGTSEESEKIDGVTITSLAPPGKPDGEVDTRG